MPCFRLYGTVCLVTAFALVMSFISNPDSLLMALTAIVAAGAVLFHERLDFLYMGYMTALGAAVEYVGTYTGQWTYPGAPWGGVPVWSFLMWGGVGLFVRRLAAPLAVRLRQATGESCAVR